MLDKEQKETEAYSNEISYSNKIKIKRASHDQPLNLTINNQYSIFNPLSPT